MWKVAPSRNITADGKERRTPRESKISEKKPQTPETRGRQRSRMNPHRPAKTVVTVVWKKGTEKSLGIELIARKGSLYKEDNSETSEGALLASTGNQIVHNPSLVEGM